MLKNYFGKGEIGTKNWRFSIQIRGYKTLYMYFELKESKLYKSWLKHWWPLLLSNKYLQKSFQTYILNKFTPVPCIQGVEQGAVLWFFPVPRSI